MAMSMLSVRLDRDLKAVGERVLARHGISATEAVRGLYRYIGQNDTIPDFCRAESAKLSSDSRRERMRQIVGIAPLSSGEDLETLKRERLSKLNL